MIETYLRRKIVRGRKPDEHTQSDKKRKKKGATQADTIWMTIDPSQKENTTLWSIKVVRFSYRIYMQM